MSLELGPYSPELAQLREGLTTKIGDLSEKIAHPEKLPFHVKLLDQVATKLHLPWYSDAITRAEKSLTLAHRRLNVLDTLQSLRITELGNRSWIADFAVSTEERKPTSFTLGCKIINEHVGRSNWSYPEYYGWDLDSSYRRAYFDYHKAHYLSHTYGWVVDQVLEQNARPKTLLKP